MSGSTTHWKEDRSVLIAGVDVDVLSADDAVDRILVLAVSPGTDVTIGVNAHVCNMARSQPTFRSDVERASLRHADGQSVVFASRLLGAPIPERSATTDLALPILRRAAEQSLPVFFLGATEESVTEPPSACARSYRHSIWLSHHGYFSADDIDTVTRAIAEHGTRILFLGLGDPAQQRWAHAHGAATGANVIVTAGGLFDWLSGAHPRPPQWMVGAGLEWLWRLRLEPKRLARRYLAGNPVSSPPSSVKAGEAPWSWLSRLPAHLCPPSAIAHSPAAASSASPALRSLQRWD